MQEGVGGGIVQIVGFTPSQMEPLSISMEEMILNIPLAKIEKAGAKILMPKHPSGKMDLWHIL
ncbi:MAG: hypothetical protein IPK03_16660 [Bacteroidetes bacterium]|nr:hypothetical protein [Bacteroidota bacterium]